ncbi:MAG: MFS transporter, partial [Pseudomonadales bacterium]
MRAIFYSPLTAKVLSLFFLGFAAGIPILLIFSTLSLWLNEAGVSKSEVTYFSWAALGYSFKFIWAPIVDKLPLPLLTKAFGRRRGWLLLSQTAVVFSILLMSSIDPIYGLSAMAFAAVLLGFSSATQDIVIDSYRIECATEEEQRIIASSYISGYRIGMLVAGAGGLFLAEYFGSTSSEYLYPAWQKAYWAMAIIMLIG